MRPGVDSAPIPLVATPFRERSPALSADGKWLAYASDETGRFEVFVRPFPDVASGKWQISSAGGSNPRWSRDGRELFYLSPEQRIMVAEVSTTPAFEASVPKPLFLARLLFPGVNIRSYYELSPDGQRFLLVSPEPGDVLAGSSVIVNWTKAFEGK